MVALLYAHKKFSTLGRAKSTRFYTPALIKFCSLFIDREATDELDKRVKEIRKKADEKVTHYLLISSILNHRLYHFK